MEVIDNTGAKEVEIVMVPKLGGVMKRYPAAGVGDMIIVSVKKGTPEMRRQILYAVVVRQQPPLPAPRRHHRRSSRTTPASSSTRTTAK